MEMVPILSTLRRNRVSAALIAVQIALTLAILCNGAFIIRQRVELIDRPTGADEASILVMSNQWIGQPKGLEGRVRTDLAGLRALPGVVDAYASNTYPLSNSGGTGEANLRANQRRPTEYAAVYFADDHTLDTLGLKLIAGRDFEPSEITVIRPGDLPHPSAVIVTRDLAQELFPKGNAVGRHIYLDAGHGASIIGVVAALQVPWPHQGGLGSTFNGASMLEPLQPAAPTAIYVVRTRPGQLAFVMHAAQNKLYAIDPSRILSNVQSLREARKEVYRDDRGFVAVLAVVCLFMFGVTGFGIVGLTSYWVAQRRRQIGIRRALGATRPAILRYFQTENLLIAAAGGVAGIALGLAANIWMVASFEIPRMPAAYLLAGLAAVLALGQLAAFWPALRAASVSPAVATRNI